MTVFGKWSTMLGKTMVDIHWVKQLSILDVLNPLKIIEEWPWNDIERERERERFYIVIHNYTNNGYIYKWSTRNMSVCTNDNNNEFIPQT